eukprot:395885-Pyramimonas_sp.AAC.1
MTGQLPAGPGLPHAWHIVPMTPVQVGQPVLRCAGTRSTSPTAGPCRALANHGHRQEHRREACGRQCGIHPAVRVRCLATCAARLQPQ